MSEILRFNVTQADARIDQEGNITVNCYYPRNPELISSRAKEDLPWGIHTFEKLLREGYAPLMDQNHPFVPPSAGSIYLFDDQRIVIHRRDRDAPTHKLYHSISAGYPSTTEEMFTAAGLKNLALRESAEECLLITKDKKPWLIVPMDSKEYTLASAERLGLNLKPRYVEVETVSPTDTLNVFYEDGAPIFTFSTFLDFIYESSTSFNALQIRQFPLSSQEVQSIDAETFRGQHLNRESYLIGLEEVVPFGQPLPHPQVYQTQINDGIPHLVPVTKEPPYFGPDLVETKHLHLFAPDNLLVRLLDALAVPGYKRNWIQIELWKEYTKLAGENLLSPAAQQRLEKIMVE